MKCPNCQKENEPGEVLCTSCGASLSSIDEAQPSAPEPPVPTDTEKKETPEPTRDKVVAKWQREYEQDATEGEKTVTGFALDNFRNVFLITAIPIVVLAVISAAGTALEQPSYFESAFPLVWLSAVALWAAAIIAGIIFAVLRKGEIAAGIFAGVGVGIIALGITCFSNLAFGL